MIHCGEEGCDEWFLTEKERIEHEADHRKSGSKSPSAPQPAQLFTTLPAVPQAPPDTQPQPGGQRNSGGGPMRQVGYLALSLSCIQSDHTNLTIIIMCQRTRCTVAECKMRFNDLSERDAHVKRDHPLTRQMEPLQVRWSRLPHSSLFLVGRVGSTEMTFDRKRYFIAALLSTTRLLDPQR